LKRFAFLITSLARSGAKTQLVYLATHLKARGWDVRVISMFLPAAYVEGKYLAYGIPHRNVLQYRYDTKIICLRSCWLYIPPRLYKRPKHGFGVSLAIGFEGIYTIS